MHEREVRNVSLLEADYDSVFEARVGRKNQRNFMETCIKDALLFDFTLDRCENT